MKKHWHIFVGIAIVVLAVLIVLGVVFLPRLAAKSDMAELLEGVAASDTQYVMLVDPTFKYEGILAGEGREVRLEGEALLMVREKLTAFSRTFSYRGKESAEGAAFCLHLLAKTADGEILKIYFAESDLYAVLKGSVYRFTVNDVQAYTAFYNALIAALPA